MVCFAPSRVLGASALSLLLLLQSGCERKAEKPGVPDAASQPAPSSSTQASAVPTSFDEVSAQLDRGGSLYFYLSTQQWLAGLSQQIASFQDLILAAAPGQSPADRDEAKHGFEMLTDLLKNGGIEQMTGVGASSIAIEPDLFQNKLFFHHARGQGNGFLWSIFGKSAHPLEGLDLLPEKTAMAVSFDLDLPQILKIIRQEIDRSGDAAAKKGFDEGMEKLSAELGAPVDQILNSLGGSLGLILTLDPAKPLDLPSPKAPTSIPSPQLALFIQVKDDQIFQQIDKSLSASPQLTKVDDPDLHMRMMPASPLSPGLSVRLTVAQAKGMLIVASDEQVVRDMLAARAGKGGFKSTAAFAKLAAGLPTQGNGFQLTTKVFSETLLKFQREIMKNQPAASPQELALVEKLFGGASAGASYTVSSALDNGWLAVGKSKTGGSLLAGPAVVPVAVLAGVAAFSRARERAKSVNEAAQVK